MKNKLIEDKIKEFKDIFVEMHPMNGHDAHNTPLLYNTKYEDVVEVYDFLTQSITTAYQAGQEDMKKKILEGMVEHKPHLGSENQDEYVAFSNGYNECCEEIIKLLEKI